MTTSVTAAGRPAPGATAVEWLTQWVKDHKRAAAYIAAVLAIAAALFVWNLLSTRTAERSAGRQLEQGRLALASRNYQLAASVLSQVTENYAGTHAAPYPFLRAQFLSDAGRAWLAAGDTAKAIAAYQTIARQLDSTSAAVEAKVRIGELTKGATAGAIPR